MQIHNLYPGSFGSNCYLLTSGTHAMIVDPSADADRILQAAAKLGAKPERILLTHGHFDHLLSVDLLRDKTGVPACIHEADLELPEDARKNAYFHFFHRDHSYRRPEITFRDGDILPLGDEQILVLSTPGHTQGSVCFLCGTAGLPENIPADAFLLTGDTLFADNCGRCDLFGGDPAKMQKSLRRLQNLPATMRIYPGHGESSVLGDALQSVLPSPLVP